MKKLIVCFLLNFIAVNISAQNLMWAKVMGNTGGDVGNSIVTDAVGNVFTTGYFEGNVDFDPSSATYTLGAAGKRDIFISKLDALGNFQWARAFGDTGVDWSSTIISDPAGNVFVAGYFCGTVDFDPGPSSNTIASATKRDIFILKLDNSGNLVWVKTIGSNSFGSIISLAIDLSGNVYSSGDFQGTADLDPGIGTYTASSLAPAASESFVLKLDASGNFVWARATGGDASSQQAGSIFPLGLVVDAAQNVFTTGRYIATCDFDPSPSTYSLTSVGWSYDIFISKLDAGGNFVWAKTITAGGMDWSASITLDPLANIYICGYFSGTADFDTGPGTYTLVSSYNNAFVAKYDSAGTLSWARQLVGTNDEGAYSIARTSSGKIFTTGWFRGTVDFDPGPATYNLSSFGDFDTFVSELDASGNFISAYKIGGIGTDGGNDLCLDVFGNVLLTGIFNNTCDFDPGTAAVNYTAVGGSDIFIVKLGGCNAAVSTQPINQTSSTGNSAQFIAASSNTASTFQWQVNTGFSFVNLNSSASVNGATSATLTLSNLLLAQNNYSFRCVVTTEDCIDFSNSAILTVLDFTGIEEHNGEKTFVVYPNPSKDRIVITTKNPALNSYTITDQTGRIVLSGKLNGTETSVDIGALSSGLYFIVPENNKPIKIVKE